MRITKLLNLHTSKIMVEKLNRSFDNDNVPAHLKIPFSEMDPLELKVMQEGAEIKLMTYRYKVPASI